MVGMINKEAVTPQVNQEKGCPMEVLAPHPREGSGPRTERRDGQRAPGGLK